MKIAWAVVCAAAVLSTEGVAAQPTPATNDRFSFTVPGGSTRLTLTVDHWSTEADRQIMLTALHNGPANLAEALARSSAAGYLNWPGGLQYIVRYAQRVAASGGEDVVIALDRPLNIWWDQAVAPAPADAPAVIQIHVGADGRGEGRVSSTANVIAGKDALALQNVSQRPPLLADVQRERAGNG